MGKIAKFLLPVMAAVVGVVGTAGTTMAAEGDYQKYYDEAYDSVKNLSIEQKVEALTLAINATDNQIEGFKLWKDVPFALRQITGEICAAMYNNPWFDGCGGPSLKWQVVGLLQNKIFGAGGETPTDADEALAAEPYQDLLDKAVADARYKADEEYAEEINGLIGPFVHWLSFSQNVVRQLNLSDKNTDQMTASELYTILSNSSYAQKYGIDDWYTPGTLVFAYAEAHQHVETYAGGHVVSDDNDLMVKAYAELVARAKLVNANFSVDLRGIAETAPVKKLGVPDTGEQNQEDKSASVVVLAVAGIAGLAGVLGALVMAKRYAYSPLKRK